MEVTLRNWILPQKEKFSKGDLFEEHKYTFSEVPISLLHPLLQKDQEGEGEEIQKERLNNAQKFKVYSDILS